MTVARRCFYIVETWISKAKARSTDLAFKSRSGEQSRLALTHPG